MVISTANLPLMKLNMHSILEALFMPKPNEYLKRNQTNSQYGNGLILVPVPQKSSNVMDQIREAKRK
jgi:hypothetical protein